MAEPVNFGFAGNPVGAHVTVAVLTASTDVPRPVSGDFVLFQNGAQPIRYTLDGSTPTASHGFRMAASEFRVIEAARVVNIKVIDESGASTLQYQWMNYLPSNR